jgi:hypothetical protein
MSSADRCRQRTDVCWSITAVATALLQCRPPGERVSTRCEIGSDIGRPALGIAVMFGDTRTRASPNTLRWNGSRRATGGSEMVGAGKKPADQRITRHRQCRIECRSDTRYLPMPAGSRIRSPTSFPETGLHLSSAGSHSDNRSAPALGPRSSASRIAVKLLAGRLFGRCGKLGTWSASAQWWGSAVGYQAWNSVTRNVPVSCMRTCRSGRPSR